MALAYSGIYIEEEIERDGKWDLNLDEFPFWIQYNLLPLLLWVALRFSSLSSEPVSG